ncbi:hypothetical protein CDL12_29904 [Handroanthus impetiginosus]|uniref:K+ potassium transporter integral membrane domain-containing protein n=1 Tax=Handroanthus impetiginosus TaxID=429701 RepID=A0A2G9FX38_9LAMI|nr:hypothetical protein CDL12_29904 [Handroanthus impetiginosus]
MVIGDGALTPATSVYGDLGTSPVNVFSSTRLKNLSEEDLVGTLSLMIWSLTSLVLIKYVFIVLHANDHGEGGTFALYSYICRHVNFKSKLTIQNRRFGSDSDMTYHSGRMSSLGTKTKKFLEGSCGAQNFLTFVVLLGTCMVIGDGALTPATSALQGIQSRSSKITQVVLLLALFAFQRCGTSKVSFSFSPIMLMWFITNVSIGVYNIIKYHPSIIRAVSPHYFVKFFMSNGKTAWDLLGAVFLGITGAEAMFADLGHFNKRAMQVETHAPRIYQTSFLTSLNIFTRMIVFLQLGYSFVVFPTLILSYAGEAVYLVKNPEKIMDAYYSSLPDSVYWPMFVISTLAAVVASQSMISASFSIVKQSLELGCFPRVKIIHTSSKHEGQVYSPVINYILMILTVGLVVGFRGGIELANAYVMLVIWKTNILLVLCFFLPYMAIESIFMISLLNKIPQGGWVPFAISAFFLAIMLSWTYGTNIVDGIPPIICHYIQHTNSVREIMVILTIRTLPISTVLQEERLNVARLGNEGFYRCLAQFGYKDSQDLKGDDFVESVVRTLQEVTDTRTEKQKIQSAGQKEIVFVVGRTMLKANRDHGVLARFTIDYLYRFLQKNSRAAVSTPEIPSERTLQVGMLYEI